MFPKGNQGQNSVSVYLECIDASDIQQKLPEGWHICASFVIVVSNPAEPTSFKSLDSQYRWKEGDTDWGFSDLIKTQQLSIPFAHNEKPILENDTLLFTVHLKVLKDTLGTLFNSFLDWDSRKETGFVGLKNQGATCYLNSLIQSLYFTNYFRKATYQIPTDTDDPLKSVPLALQRLFYNMQYSKGAPGTTELTKSFGWDTMDAFFQHDVQELNRVLQDNLESKMKGTKAEGAIRKLFTGKMKSFIKCINVDYESSRVEDFYDIQLNVKGCKTLHDSFVEYCVVETMDGENKYFAEGFGLQDARKGVIFKQFPPVLHLQLKRFEYDFEKDALVKMNDRHEFPLTIQLDMFLEEKDPAMKQTYHLHGVLVHSGELHAGHYCAFIRPNVENKWFKFDDDRVIPVSAREVTEENYGGEFAKPQKISGVQQQPRISKRFTNAYMLVYVRESDLDLVLSPVTDADIPEHLAVRFLNEQKEMEKRRKERDEQHLYFNVKVLSDDVIAKHEGPDLCNFDDKQHPISELHTFKTKKQDTFQTFCARVAEHFRVQEDQMRLWNLVSRQNKTIRPDAPLRFADDIVMEEVLAKITRNSTNEMRLYLEVSETPIGSSPTTGKPFYFPAEGSNSDILVFIKRFDPASGKGGFYGAFRLPKDETLNDVCEMISKHKGVNLSPGDIALYEEVKPTMVDPIKLDLTFTQAEISDGDIIWFQPKHTEEESHPGAKEADAITTVPLYLEYLSNRLIIVFKPKSKQLPNKGDITLTLSKKMVYDTVVSNLAAALSFDPMKIQLTSSATGKTTQVPKSVIRPSRELQLQVMVGVSAAHQSYMPNELVLFYEMLDISIHEFETKKYFKVLFLDANLKEHGPFELLLLKTAKVSDLIQAAKLKVGYGGERESLRLFEVKHGRYEKVLEPQEVVSVISDSTTLQIEVICD